jgi:hypothetical protein
MKLTTVGKIQKVHATLDEILVNPPAFGVRKSLPQPLTDSLRSMRDTLSQALKDMPNEKASFNLETE